MKVKISYTGGASFKGETDSGHTLIMDGAAEYGGEDKGVGQDDPEGFQAEWNHRDVELRETTSDGGHVTDGAARAALIDHVGGGAADGGHGACLDGKTEASLAR